MSRCSSRKVLTIVSVFVKVPCDKSPIIGGGTLKRRGELLHRKATRCQKLGIFRRDLLPLHPLIQNERACGVRRSRHGLAEVFGELLALILRLTASWAFLGQPYSCRQ